MEAKQGTGQLINSFKNRNKPAESRRSNLTNAHKKYSEVQTKKSIPFRPNAKSRNSNKINVESNWTSSQQNKELSNQNKIIIKIKEFVVKSKFFSITKKFSRPRQFCCVSPQ